jgi:hypothetical protein
MARSEKGFAVVQCASASSLATSRHNWPPAGLERHCPSSMLRSPTWWHGDFHSLTRRLATSISPPSTAGAMLDIRTLFGGAAALQARDAKDVVQDRLARLRAGRGRG